MTLARIGIMKDALQGGQKASLQEGSWDRSWVWKTVWQSGRRRRPGGGGSNVGLVLITHKAGHAAVWKC